MLGSEGAEAAAAAPNWFVQHAFLIPLLCFASAALTLFFGKKTPGKGPVYGILALSAGLVLSLGVLWGIAHNGANYEHNITWFTIGPFSVDVVSLKKNLVGAMLILI